MAQLRKVFVPASSHLPDTKWIKPGSGGVGCERPIATEDTGPSHQPLRWLEWISLVLRLTLDLKVSDECSTTELRPDYPFSFLVLVRFGF